MLISFDDLPGNARVWIYQADKKLNAADKESLSQALSAFCEQWQAHGQPLRTSYRIAHDQFVILGVDVDYTDTSGCSIDGSVRILKEFQQQHGVDFFNRNLIAFREKNEVNAYPMADVKKLFISGHLSSDSLSFNNLVATKSDLENNWLVKVGESWFHKYLPNTAVPGK